MGELSITQCKGTLDFDQVLGVGVCEGCTYKRDERVRLGESDTDIYTDLILLDWTNAYLPRNIS